MLTPLIRLETYDFQDEGADPDANFKRDVAFYSRIDPMPTIQGMSRNLDIPEGAIARYVLVKWAASGNEGLMEMGPRVIRQMASIVEEAERHSDDRHRLAAYHKLRQIVSWLNVGL